MSAGLHPSGFTKSCVGKLLPKFRQSGKKQQPHAKGEWSGLSSRQKQRSIMLHSFRTKPSVEVRTRGSDNYAER